ncbi:glycoside hydrolase family 18 protein [Roseixanthobacter liquoris]|uniref:glycoside hydrolase family 18 protein n=1 Tax=Roseixanthobacter liquoris TaxID=3119921 RepID=UPI003727B760
MLAACAALLLAGGTPARAAEPPRPFLAYHASWYEVQTSVAADTSLARLPGYLTHVALSFAKPDLVYAGDLDLKGTGLLYPFSGAVLKQAVALLKARQPGIKVLISVGGWGYFAWDKLDAPALARLVRDLGADGVDVDYETPDPACVPRGEGMECNGDDLSIAVVEQVRKALPRPFVVSVAGWSVGAYGSGDFRASAPRSPWTGSILALLAAPVAGEIDLVSIMSYDAGPRYRPQEAFRAYRRLWKGPLMLGVQVMPSEAGGPRFTVDYTRRILGAVTSDPLAGAMLYAVRLTPPGVIGPDNPDDRYLAATICMALDLANCSAPMP